MNSIEVKGLKKTYKKRIRALDGLYLSVPQGCIFGLLGPNGAGKSTAINIMAGLVRKDEGEINILGKKVEENDYEYKRNIGFVLERPHYVEKLTAKEYLEFVAAMFQLDKRKRDKQIDELLGFFELEEKRDEWIASFSMGMKKKVLLAAAMIHQPKLLILDEPLESIDPLSAKAIKDNLKLMTTKGMTILLSSHNLYTVEKFCDEIAIIAKGKIVFEAKTEEIKNKIKNEVSQETYASLEEIFVEVVNKNSTQRKKDKLSWV
jgi:ABC-2 type transport system ATP-binding protein